MTNEQDIEEPLRISSGIFNSLQFKSNRGANIRLLRETVTFIRRRKRKGRKYTIVIPPPNVTCRMAMR